MKKYSWLILNLSSWFLKQLTELTWTAGCGRLFQLFTTLAEKKQSLTSHLLCSFTSFHLWPRVARGALGTRTHPQEEKNVRRHLQAKVVSAPPGRARVRCLRTFFCWAGEINGCTLVALCPVHAIHVASSVFNERELKFMFAIFVIGRPSVCRLSSVVCL